MKNQEEETQNQNLRMNAISPKHNSPTNHNFNGNSTSYYHNINKNSEYSKLQNPSKLAKKKIAPLENVNNKGIFMSKTNKSDFMKFINKTLQQDENNYNPEEENSLNNNTNKKNGFKKMNDLSINLNSPNNSNMKKTLNLYSSKNSNGPYSGKFSNINNMTSPNFMSMSSTSYSNQVSSNDNLRNFLNSASNYNNIITNNLSPHGHNSYNSGNFGNVNYGVNYGYSLNKSRFLYDPSNFMKFSKVDSAKFATKPAGIITSFGVNTNFGNVR